MTFAKKFAAAIFLTLLLGASAAQAQTAISDKRIQDAAARFAPHTAFIDSLACAWRQDPAPVLAIVAPEWVRYSLVRDLMETQALEWAYVRLGRSAADFSIGPCQMKPSFIEDLENALPPCLKAHFAYKTDNSVLQRKLRLARLKDLSWQFHYAFAFYALCRERFELPDGEAAQASFIAAAYNYGFTRPEEEICRWEGEQVFPYGRAFRGPQESYSQAALRFYERFRKKST
jgi:hypothetical protein